MTSMQRKGKSARGGTDNEVEPCCATHIPDGEVDEDPHKMDDAADQAFQLADDGARVLEGQGKVLAVLVDLQHSLTHVVQRDLAITIHVQRFET